MGVPVKDDRTSLVHPETDTTVKVAVIYHSATGHVADIARELSDAAEKAGAEVRLRKVAELEPLRSVASLPARVANATATADISVAAVGDVLWADAVLLGSPARFGNIAAQLARFIESLGGAWKRGALADKIYSGFTSTASAHGGNEATLLALMNSFHHFGGIVVTPGFTHPDKFVDGNPYGTAHHDGSGTLPVGDVTRNAARVQAERVVRLAGVLRAASVRPTAHRRAASRLSTGAAERSA
uniref:Putative WrbA NAD(P)H:quinone oxidoreductase n=1 Tax=Streptomyces anulatus TaxID=1892 RepID=C4PWA9_STRAQ|nr:putative WrbA NAD(P)H:quinone oxidoreductase [Streptomyces anulatus]